MDDSSFEKAKLESWTQYIKDNLEIIKIGLEEAGTLLLTLFSGPLGAIVLIV